MPFLAYWSNLLRKNYDILPDKVQHMLPYIEKYDWLYNYQFLEGMKSVLEGMNKRTKLILQLTTLDANPPDNF